MGVVYLMFALWRLIEIVDNDLGGNTVAAEFMLFIKTRQVPITAYGPKVRLRWGKALRIHLVVRSVSDGFWAFNAGHSCGFRGASPVVFQALLYFPVEGYCWALT